MILIFSRSRDPATNAVVAWLDRLGCEFVRINEDDPSLRPVPIRMTATQALVEVGERWLSTDELSAVWYRKGGYWFPGEAQPPAFDDQKALADKLAGRLDLEQRVAREFFHHLVRRSGARVLGNAFLPTPNKLVVLRHAFELGLSIPPFEATSIAHRLDGPCAGDFICKALSDGLHLWDFDGARRGYFSYTESLSDVLDPNRGSDLVPLSLVQKRISKAYEVRSFFLDGSFMSAAILSQSDLQTQVDYRKYNYAKPNRNVPIVLPALVEDRLRALFKRLDLNTGSVDMIVDDEGDHVFLEINPTGQYTGIGSTCNYDIDRKIAVWLAGA